MTAYADSLFYSDHYLNGKSAVVPAQSFNFFAIKASSYINRYTLDNIGDEIPEAVKMCCCELAELIYKADTSPAANGLVNEKVGDISVSYESGESQRQAMPKQVKSVIRSWLAGSGLLYHGGSLC